MPRTTPTNFIDELGPLDDEPLEKREDYSMSKKNDSFFSKPPIFDSCGRDNSPFYVEAKFEHKMLQDYYKVVREEQAKQSEINDSRIKTLRKDHQDLQEGFVGLNNFIRDSDEKKKIAIKKIDNEIVQHNELKEMIETKRQNINDLTIFREKFTKSMQLYRPYEEVLEKVVGKREGFDSVQDIINHCDGIMLAFDNLMNHNVRLTVEIMSMRKRMVEIAQKAQFIVLGLSNQLSHLHRTYNAVFLECQQWEQNYGKVCNALNCNKLKKARVMEAINTMYRLLCKRRRVFQNCTKFENKLDFILEEVFIIREVLTDYDRKKGTKLIDNNESFHKC